MSFFDALLLDEYRDPKDLWISQREDGQPGSGTAADPANGATRLLAPQYLFDPVTYDNRTVLVRTDRPHGYPPGHSASITLTAYDSAERPARGPWYFLPLTNFTWVSEFAFTCRVATDPEAPPDPMYLPKCPRFPPSPGDEIDAMLFWPIAKVTAPNHGFSEYEAIKVEGIGPAEFNGDAIAVGVEKSSASFFYRLSAIPPATQGIGGKISRYRYGYDEVLRKAPASSLIRLGTAPPEKPFETRGICSAFVTNIAEIANKWKYYPGLSMLDGQRILGSGIQATILRVVFAVDPNNQTSVIGRLTSPNAMLSGEVADLTLDCWMQGQLKVPTAVDAVAFPLVAKGMAPVTVGGVAIYGYHLRIRRVQAINFAPQSYPECFVLFTNGASTGSALPKANDVIEDCIVETPGENSTHESTTIWPHCSSGSSEQSFIQANGVACVARHNFVHCTFPNLGSSKPIRISSMTSPPGTTPPSPPYVGPTLGPGEFSVVFREPHNRTAEHLAEANIVVFQGVSGGVHPYNGWFLVVSVYDPVTLVCRMFDIPSMSAPSISSSTAMSIDYHGPVAYSGSGGVTEGNAVYDCLNPGYNDTGSTRDIAFRYNYYSDVFTGFNQNLTGVTNVRAINPSGGVVLVGLTTVEVDATDHYLSAGDIVILDRVDSTGVTNDPQYNGVFFVEKAETTSKFQYRLNAEPTFPPAGSQAQANYAGYAQTKRAVIENNCIDLYKNTPTTLPNPQGCISVQGQKERPGSPDWVVRDNAFRHTDGIPTNLTGFFSGLSPALRMNGLNGGVIQSNLIDLESPYPLQYLRTKIPPPSDPTSMNNTSMGGKLLRGGNFPSGGNAPDSYFEELATRIEDSLIFGM